RAGEMLRCYLISRFTGLPLSVSISSAVIERVFDGLWLCACLFLTLTYIPLPQQFHRLIDGAFVLGTVVVVGAVLLAVAMTPAARKLLPAPRPQGWRRRFAVLIVDLELMGRSRYLGLAFAQSLPYLLLQTIPIFAAFKGYGFDLSLSAA